MKRNEFPSLIFAAKTLWRLEDAKLKPHLNDSQKLEYEQVKKNLNTDLIEYGKDLYDWFDEKETEEAGQLFYTIFRGRRDNIYSDLRDFMC